MLNHRSIKTVVEANLSILKKYLPAAWVAQAAQFLEIHFWGSEIDQHYILHEEVSLKGLRKHE